MSSDVKKRICIVGCGPAAMSALYHFTKLPDGDIPDIVCYEKQPTWGGMWNLTWRTGRDEHGEDIHACMYYDMWLNSPKELAEYPDYTCETHFGKPVPSFFLGPVLKDYFIGRFIKQSKLDLRQYVRFNTVVRWIDYDEKADDFVVKVKDLIRDKDSEERFTHVIMATGLFGHAYTPTIPGLESFQGQIIHAKEVRRATVFQGKRILLVGSSFSAQDLTLQLIKYGAAKVIMSHHNEPTGLKFPEGVEERPAIIEFGESAAYFKDETKSDIDVVIFCTGYRLHHPFLPENLRIKPEMNIYPDNLYRGIVWVKDGNMKFLYLGVLYSTTFLFLLDVQALWACQYIMGQLKPKKEDMIQEMKEWTRDRIGPPWHRPVALQFILRYLEIIVTDTNYPTDVRAVEGVLQQHIKNMFADYSTYRDKKYTSIYTGQLSTTPHLRWMEDFRDISDVISSYR